MRHLRAQLSQQSLNLFYSKDGETWTKNERTYELSSYDQNVLGSFSFIRLAVYAAGKGTAAIKSFQFEAL